MKTKFCKRRIISLIILIPLMVNLRAQESDNLNGFVPEVGQKGKDVVWVPTPPELISGMFSLAKVTPDDYVIDLGSGDGRVVISAAKLGAHALGIEYNHDLVALSIRNAKKERVNGNTEFIEGDFFKCDLTRATVITLFLLPEINKKLMPKLLELKPGTRIVSNTFTMSDWVPDKEVTTEDNPYGWNTAYLWIVPAKVEGSWVMGSDILTIKQSYQVIQGMLNSEGKTSSISDGKLNGSNITFRVGKYLFTGQVNEGKMSGTRTSNGEMSDWEAERIH